MDASRCSKLISNDVAFLGHVRGFSLLTNKIAWIINHGNRGSFRRPRINPMSFFYEATLNRRLLIHRRQFIIPRSSFPAPLEPFNHRYDRSYVSFSYPGGKPLPHQALLRRCNTDTKRQKYRIRRKFRQVAAKKKIRGRRSGKWRFAKAIRSLSFYLRCTELLPSLHGKQWELFRWTIWLINIDQYSRSVSRLN